MGQLVAAQAKKSGDEIGAILTSKDLPVTFTDKLSGHDVAIDFSLADAVPANVAACMRAGIPLVEGTTGWKASESQVRSVVDDSGGALVYGPNFSIGVNLFYRIVKHAAELFAGVEGYSGFIEEAHHSRKRDAPSGTALRLQAILAEALKTDIPTSSTRAGYIPGTHRVGFDSEPDQILLTHTARSRQGFAAGSLLAAHWIVGKTGMFEFDHVIDEILSRSSIT
jgi:4-hydroxy-tetrahydrodipicolinate reductase